VDELQAAARSILADIRELAQGIHPSIVTDGGVLAAVEERCSSLPIEVTLQASPDLRRARMPAQIEAAAYFLVAESLANILKHAGSARATVTLLRHDGRLSVAVADDGAGFDPRSTERRGLAGLEDRFAALGGSMHVASRPGAGTRISASLPVEP
jgi:signal transduction histidine kinase